MNDLRTGVEGIFELKELFAENNIAWQIRQHMEVHLKILAQSIWKSWQNLISHPRAMEYCNFKRCDVHYSQGLDDVQSGSITHVRAFSRVSISNPLSVAQSKDMKSRSDPVSAQPTRKFPSAAKLIHDWGEPINFRVGITMKSDG